MDRIAPEIAQEIAVLFQHDHLDTGTPKQVAEHHPRRAAAGDADSRCDFFGRGVHRVPPLAWTNAGTVAPLILERRLPIEDDGEGRVRAGAGRAPTQKRADSIAEGCRSDTSKEVIASRFRNRRRLE